MLRLWQIGHHDVGRRPRAHLRGSGRGEWPSYEAAYVRPPDTQWQSFIGLMPFLPKARSRSHPTPRRAARHSNLGRLLLCSETDQVFHSFEDPAARRPAATGVQQMIVRRSGRVAFWSVELDDAHDIREVVGPHSRARDGRKRLPVRVMSQRGEVSRLAGHHRP